MAEGEQRLTVIFSGGWVRLAQVLAIILVIGFTLPSIVSLHDEWLSYYYSHGYLVLLLTAVLVVLEVRRAPLSPGVPSWAGFACLVFLVFTTIVARALTIESVEQLAWPFTWVAAIWALAGGATARRLAVPLAYLCVAIPVWDVLVDPLRNLTIWVVSAWIHAAGMPASIEGNLIHVPSGTFEIAGGCAGLRYTLVALALASFSGLFYRRTLTQTAWLTISALALALVGNWVRVFVTVVAGHSPETSVFLLVRDQHSLFGWVVFVVFLSPWIYLDRCLQTKHAASTGKVLVDRHATTRLRRSGVAYASCALLAFAVWLAQPFGRAEPAAAAQVFEIPEIGGWTKNATWQDSRLPVFSGATTEVASWYSDGRARVGVYVANYARQRQREEVVSLSNRPAGRNGTLVRNQTMAVEAGSGATLSFQELEVSDPGDNRRLVWVIFRVAGSPTSNIVGAKFFQVVGVMRGRYDAQSIVLTTSCASDCGEARSSLRRYAAIAAEPLFEVAETSLLIESDGLEAEQTSVR